MEKIRGIKHNRPTIGVLAGWPTYPGAIHSFLDHVFRGIQAAALDFDCNLFIGCTVNSPFHQNASQVMPVLLPGAEFIPIGPWNTNGLLIAGPLFNEPADRYLQNLIDSGFPVIYAGDRETGPSVIVDNEGGIQLAVDHLVTEHRHRKIAFIAGYEAQHGDSAARWRGYRIGLKRHGILYDPDLVAIGLHSTESSYRAMCEILEKRKSFSAVITSNDESAVGAIQALRDFGLLVPNDVAVIGFDDRLEARAHTPLLTSVQHPMFELGYQSVELLTQIISGKAPPDSLRQISTHLVIRESCGCLPGNQPDTQYKPKWMMDTAVPISQPFHGSFHPRAASAPVAGPVDPEILAVEITSKMAKAVHGEMQRMRYPEIEYLCQRLMEAYVLSLQQNDIGVFQLAMQQILEHTAALDGDLHAWHGAISVLRKWTQVLLQALPTPGKTAFAENLFHEARIAISEIQRGQHARMIMQESEVANLINQMSTRFFAAKNEDDIFRILNESIRPLNIRRADVFYFLADQQDPYALSEVKTPLLENGASPVFPTRMFPPDGLYSDSQPMQLALLPIFLPDGVHGYVVFQTHNLAPLGQIVRQLVAALHSVCLYQKTVQARKQAEDANNQKSMFLSVVSHELRTPLSLIYGLSNMLLEESTAVSENERMVSIKDLRRIYIGAQHLESLIRDVLDLARSDVDQLELMLEPVNPREVLEMVSAIGEQLAHDKDLAWETDFPDELPLVRADRTRLRQIILNLVNNAVKFTGQGSITLSACASDGLVTIAVRDTGLGIPKEEQQAIFHEFHQSRRTTARGYGGLGLGLAICKRLVEMQGGKIGVSSSGKEGAGSLFFFNLPVFQASGKVSNEPQPIQDRRQVLILVKDLDGSSPLYQHLTGQGFHVNLHQITQYSDCLSIIHEIQPDQIMLDLALTSERGWEILKTLKENPATCDLPILFFDIQNEKDQGGLLDLNYMTKPLRPDELVGELTLHGLPPGNGCEGYRPILIVDDDPEILSLHMRILESVIQEYPILKAKNGREALEIIRQERPALVLLDLMMPEMDGFEVLETMQEEDLIRSTSVIVLTGQVLTEEDVSRLNCGVANVLGKGMFTAQETITHVTDALARKYHPATESHRMSLKAIAYLHSRYKDPISRADIASHIGVSERHLSRCFLQEVGLTPMTYLHRLRVKMAKSLLETKNMSITEIALEVGFSSAGYFARIFREEEGISPREYLNQKNIR